MDTLWRVSTEAARRGRVRSTDWVRVSRGVYRPRPPVSGSDGPAGLGVLPAWQLVLPPEGAFTHLTSALARGWPTPPLPVDLPVFAAVPDPVPRLRRPGLRVMRCVPPLGVDLVGGLRIARPADSLLAAARDLHLLDLVVLIDAALHVHACTPDDIARVATTGKRGAPMLRTALAWADGRAESAWETVLRVFHRVCEVPVQPQFVIADEGGEYRADLRIVGSRRLVEYDGEVHRDAAQHGRDLHRERRLQRLGWQRFGYTSQALKHNAVSVLRDADDALGRPHDPSRIRAWHAMLARSLFTAAGTAIAQRRWTSQQRRR